MNEQLKTARDFFEKLDKIEFIDLLEQAGFEVENGEGKIVYTEPLESTFTFAFTVNMDSCYKRSINQNSAGNKIEAFPMAS